MAHNNENVSGISAYLLGLIIGDGGLYKLKYKGNRSEYRVVITQKSENLIKQHIAPLMQFLIDELNVKSKIQIVKGDTRYELRVSSKKLYYYFANMLERIRLFNMREQIAFIKGLYVAEGDKTLKRLRIWNKNKALLEIVSRWLNNLGVRNTIHLDDHRHGVYVLNISLRDRIKFVHTILSSHLNPLPPEAAALEHHHHHH
uniref:HOMING ENDONUCLEASE I-DMOI n=2 Tax=Desulfurococcus mucosus TaxID=2275 RepID=UPI00018408C0|nr:Chain A, HOMING ENDONUCLEASE I-DMOI [Desulfurococcus mucosus]2VS8_F Chain F, HOMING ENDONUCLEASE I-DMOI [Desulfurococcus mucosus]2VS8_K Chain K, HOMING ENDONUCLEASE I-DMOI [Desulfurococcus mucosus]